ncbi:MAG TPA: hypothetical protein VGL13_13130, partial [Polyangiaceae bacterium]
RLPLALLALLEHVVRVSPSAPFISVKLETHDGKAALSFSTATSVAPSPSVAPPAEGAQKNEASRHVEGRPNVSHAERLKGIAAHLAELVIVRQGGTVLTEDEGRGRVTMRVMLPVAAGGGS